MKNEKYPFIIAGPCSAETRAQTLDTYARVAATGVVDMFRAGVWKPRTMPGCFEGIGPDALEWLSEGRDLTGLPFGVEVANSVHTRAAIDAGADMVWIGARTTANPFCVDDIAREAAGSGVRIFVKNPLNPDVKMWSGAIERLLYSGIPRETVGIIHRGFSCPARRGYRNPPMWRLALEMRRLYPDLLMLCDPSHICGNRDMLADTARKAAGLSYDGLIVESHTDPGNALSDPAQQLKPGELKEMLESIVWRRRRAACAGSLFK